MKTVATIEARMTSSRLPGKVLLEATGEPMLHHLIHRLKHTPSVDEIVLATTVNPSDDILAEMAQQQGIHCFRGSEDDVLLRVLEAGQSVQADTLVEITADCPIIDPQIVEQGIRTFYAHDADYVSNAKIRSYPDGMDVQVFPLAVLARSAEMTQAPLDREHVTLHIRNHPEIFRQIHLIAPPNQHWPELGLTLDEEADYQLLKRIIEFFGPEHRLFTCLETLELLRQKPEWLTLNQHIIRKGNT